MGKNRRFRRQNKDANQPKGGNSSKIPYELSLRESESFIRYYQLQGIVPDGEWDSFYSTLQETLPSVFRITGHRRQAKELMRIIRSDFFSKMVEVELEGRKVAPPQSIAWYPDELAWQLDLSRKMIRASPSLKQLHDFLVSETESGNISRQESVSMIPPLVLDVQPHHKILDMCAAPGSKTAQIIEYLHKDAGGSIPDGYVVANDKDNKRCYLMVHQVKRLQSPCFMIVNHDATLIPTLFTHSKDGSKKEFVAFDRILADVPCSGDGTLRKNQDLWAKWNPGLGINLHPLQSRILDRGLELLAVGGRLVYSTCSFNPVENEAVVASTLLRCEGSVRLVDVSNKLPGLRTVQGKTTWKVVTRKEEIYSSFSEASPNHLAFLRESMFPPSEEDSKSMNLHYCLRVLPHHQDTGGFFIAVFERVGQLPWMKGRVTQVTNIAESAPKNSEKTNSENSTSEEKSHDILLDNKIQPEDEGESEEIQINDSKSNLNENVPTVESREDSGTADVGSESKSDEQMVCLSESGTGDAEKRKEHGDIDNASESLVKKRRIIGHREEPFLFFNESDPVWPSIRDFFRVKPSFRADQLMYRCEGGSRRTLYFVSDGIKSLVQCNTDRVKFINMGVKIFGRSPSPVVPQCDFRLSQEGLGSVASLLEGRWVMVTRDDIITMLTNENPLFSTLKDSTQKQLDTLCPGSVIFHFKPNESDPSPDCELVICGWRGKTSVRPFVSKNDSQHYLRLCDALPVDGI